MASLQLREAPLRECVLQATGTVGGAKPSRKSVPGTGTGNYINADGTPVFKSTTGAEVRLPELGTGVALLRVCSKTR